MSEKKAEVQDLTSTLQESQKQNIAHRTRQEELAAHIDDLVSTINETRSEYDSLSRKLDTAKKQHEEDLRREHAEVEAKDSALKSTLDDLSKALRDLAAREAELKSLGNAVTDAQAMGASQSSERLGMQVEIDRLKREVATLEDLLQRARKDLDDREDRGRDRESSLDHLYVQKKELESQLAAQTQARLNLSEKLDAVQAALKTNEAELSSVRSKLNEAEATLAKTQRSMLGSESQYRDQLTERNTLLLTIYQYMDKILGVDKTPVRDLLLVGIRCLIS